MTAEPRTEHHYQLQAWSPEEKGDQAVNELSNEVSQPYESPILTEVGKFGDVTQGQYSRTHSDDGDAGGYWNE